MAQIKCPQCAYLNDSGTIKCRQCGTALPSISFEAHPSKAENKPAAPPPASGTQFRRGQVVNNRYTVLDLIGRGGMGCIYKVHDNVLGEDLALKTLLPQFLSDKTIVDRFLNEARITRRLAHPNIVRVHDIGTAGNGIYISMECVQGDSLRTVLERQRPGERIPVRQVLHIIDQLCLALDYAHQYTIHRDIKPENIMITQDNQIKLMDFGISKLMDNRFMTAASMVMGTPYYMSPEQLRNSRDVDARADVYSVGVVLYELLTGNMPTGVPKPASQMLKEIPPALDGIVAKCVDPDLNKRYLSAGELRTALRPIITMLDQGRDPQKTLARKRISSYAPKTGRRHLLLAGSLLLIAGLTIAALGGLEYWHRRSDKDAGGGFSPSAPAARNDSFLALQDRVEAILGELEVVQEKSEIQQKWMQEGKIRWNAALEAANAGAQEAVLLGQEAYEYYQAAYLAPEGMTFVPAGTTSINENTIYVPGFFMDVAEVTLGQFASFCRQVEGGWKLPDEVSDSATAYPDHPAVYVAWFDAQAFAAWKKKSLPTHAQWARAAYGDAQTLKAYPWGNEWKENAAHAQGMACEKVRSYSEDFTWTGCYDMAGNVAEWTRTPAGDIGEKPPDFGTEMWVAGGSFLGPQPLYAFTPYSFETRAAHVGFRCVVELDRVLK